MANHVDILSLIGYCVVTVWPQSCFVLSCVLHPMLCGLYIITLNVITLLIAGDPTDKSSVFHSVSTI